MLFYQLMGYFAAEFLLEAIKEVEEYDESQETHVSWLSRLYDESGERYEGIKSLNATTRLETLINSFDESDYLDFINYEDAFKRFFDKDGEKVYVFF